MAAGRGHLCRINAFLAVLYVNHIKAVALIDISPFCI